MVTRIFTLLGVFLLVSCIGQQKLKDGITTVPLNHYVFKNKTEFSSIVFKNINIDNLYELKTAYYSDKNFNKVRASQILGSYFLQFYSNGCVRGMDYLESNPEISGYRGVIYFKNKNIWIDRAGLSSDRSLKIYTYKIKIDGDIIYLLEIPKTLFTPSEYSCLVYQKSENIPEDWKKYKADW